MTDDLSWLATAARGTEPVLARELEGLGATDVRPGAGGVTFRGSAALARRANLWLRSANHVLLRLAGFPVGCADELYAAAYDVRWEDLLTLRTTFAVTAGGRAPGLHHSGFAALRVKDAVADRMRDRCGARPDVDPRDPDVRIVLQLGAGRGTLFLDSSGRSLHLRGWRRRATEAPLRETLAAAIVLWSGWDRRRPLCDPLCGSGTLAVEAALWAADRAPGRRRPFGFERWPSFGEAEARSWRALLEEADARAAEAAARRERPSIRASDRDPEAATAAELHAAAAGVGGLVRVETADARRFAPPEPSGMVLCNPPYGERLAPGRATLDALYHALAHALRPAGWVAIVLSGNPGLARAFPTRPAARLALRNGALRCELLRWDARHG
ncbi:MAG: methyltransferase [Deltaproteobacteria bacterium]|nr:methyltransferase [Deltaproteobacteria bacterium]